MATSYLILWGRRVATAKVDGTDLVIEGAAREAVDLNAVTTAEISGNKVTVSGTGFNIDFTCGGSKGLRNAQALLAEIEQARTTKHSPWSPDNGPPPT